MSEIRALLIGVDDHGLAEEIGGIVDEIEAYLIRGGPADNRIAPVDGGKAPRIDATPRRVPSYPPRTLTKEDLGW